MLICHTKKGKALRTGSKESKAEGKKAIWAKQHGRKYEHWKEW